MIQLNLLPDVKINYIKAKRNKRTVLLVSLLVIGGSIGLFVLMFSFVQVQKKHISNLNGDIQKYKSQLETTEDVGKILTVQNQLNNLDALHDDKPVSSRLFNYIAQVTPDNISFSQITLDYATGTMTLSGKTDTLATVNKFADTLKFTDYKTGDKATGKAFSEVVLTSFSRDKEETTYQIDLKYDPIIFDNASEVSLVIPNKITTRSNVEKPSALLQEINNGDSQ